MCVSTAVLCTLASLSADAAPPAIAPPTREPPLAQASQTKHAIALPAPIETVAAPESLPLEASPAPVSGAKDVWMDSTDTPPASPIAVANTAVPDALSVSPPPSFGDSNAAIAPDATATDPMADSNAAIAPDATAANPVALVSLPTPTVEPTIQSVPEFSTTAAALTHEPLIAQATEPSDLEVQELQENLRSLPTPTENETFGDVYEGSPAVTIAIPSGYGADNWEGFANFSYQTRTRYANEDDATMGIGIGLGDARENIGVQLSYTIASFGENRDFGSGGFNAKLHRQFGQGWSAALGWEGFIGVGDDSDFEDSVYGAITHIARLSPDINDPFSRIALTAGVGSGRFRTEDAIRDGDDTLGVFGSVALRVARPVSAIVEWTGQDLAMGLSIAPIPNVPWVITPAVRDIAGGGDGARFVIGTGISWQF